MNYGDSQALILLVASRLGYPVRQLAHAHALLSRQPIHIISIVALEREATQWHNLIAQNPILIRRANHLSSQIKRDLNLGD